MPHLMFDEKILEQYSNKCKKYIKTILVFTRFLESKGYPGCAQFNFFMCDLDRQINADLIDEDFIKKQQEIDAKISQLEKA